MNHARFAGCYIVLRSWRIRQTWRGSVRKVWRQLRREVFDVACCTVAGLMNDMHMHGITRGKRQNTADRTQKITRCSLTSLPVLPTLPRTGPP
jgi:hypothetical protein